MARLFLAFRLRKGKEISYRLSERQGVARENFKDFARISKDQGRENLIWIHAASVGESLSILILIDHLLGRDPACCVMVTTGTVASALLLDQRLPPRAFHQFVPLDFQPWVRRFLDQWHPRVALWVESEIWPNLIRETSRRDIPLMMINGRISRKSFQNWQWCKSFICDLMGRFTLCFAQSPEDALRLRQLGANYVIEVENLKFASLPLTYEAESLQTLRHQIGNRPFWLAASTHGPEEEIIQKSHGLLRLKFPTLLTIIVPRHPRRGSEIKETWSRDFKIARRSMKEPIEPETEVYLVDTLGESGLFYALNSIVLVGGSLAPVGGHNLIEPAHLDCAILHGPHMFKCQKVRDLFHEAKAVIEVHSAEQLAKEVEILLESSQKCLEMAQRAQKVAQAQFQIVDKIMEEMEDFLPDVLSSS